MLPGRRVSTELSRLLPAVRLPAIVLMRVRGEAALGLVTTKGEVVVCPLDNSIPEKGLLLACWGLALLVGLA